MKHMRKFLPLLIPTLLLCLLTACHRQEDNKSCQAVCHQDWAPDVKDAINDFITTYGGEENAYAVFDFDNTCSIFDISEQLMMHQLQTMSFAMSPEDFKKMAFAHLKPEYESVWGKAGRIAQRYALLNGKYGPFTSKGVDEEAQLALSEDTLWVNFAIDMAQMYDDLQEHMTIDEAYIWVAGWFAGMTEKEQYDLALESHQKYAQAETTVRTLEGTNSTYTWTEGIQVTDNIRELWKALAEHGIDVWVCSASFLQPVMAAVDAFGLHDSCKGVLAMTMQTDTEGRFTTDYDYETGYPALANADGTWAKDTLPTGTETSYQGKVTAIQHTLLPRYGKGPRAGFMDSTGDFFFCTEFESMRLAVCFNRANRKVTEGGGLIAEVAIYERDVLGYDLAKANENGDILYVLQGRDENGLRTLRPSNKTVRAGETEEKLFCNDDNTAMLQHFTNEGLTVAEILNTYSQKAETPNPLGFPYGFTTGYPGYRSIAE